MAAACAITAGWMRMVGQVTAVVIGRSVDLRDRPDHRPHEGAVSLLVVPRVVVVGDPEGVEARGLRPPGLLDQCERGVLLTGKGETDVHGDRSFPRARISSRTRFGRAAVP